MGAATTLRHHFTRRVGTSLQATGGRSGVRERWRCLRKGYSCHMADVASRDLRNHTAEVLRRVTSGERVTITSRGRPVAEMTSVLGGRRRPIQAGELARRLAVVQADAGLRGVLAELAGDTTDDLGPLR